MPDKFEQYYKYLKANGADVAPDFNSFKNTLSDSNKASKYYSYLKENQFDVPETFDSFANTFGLKKKAGDLLSSGIPSRLPNEPNFLQQGQKVASGEIFTDISKSVPKTTLKEAAIKDKNNNNSYLGAMWNNVVASAERLAGGAARLAQKFDTSPVSMIQETVDKAASSVTGINYEAQREKEIADKVKSFIGKARTSSSSREYEQGLAEGFDITNGIGLDDLKGLGAVLPSMLTDMAIAAPTGGATFAIQGYDDALSTLDNIPEGKYMSETTRTAFGFGGAIVAGVLEKLGMDNILKSGTVTKYVTSKILKETAGELAKKGVKVTAEQFEKAVANKATQMLTKTALKNTVKAGAKSALSEGATEATQEGAMDLIKLAANQLEGSEIFDEKDLKNTAASRYLNAAAMGGIFGGTLGSIGSRTKNVQQHIEDEVKNAKTQEDIAAIIDDINENLKDGTISENDAEVFKSMVDKDISKPSTLEIQNEKETKLSDIDEFINSLDRNDRLYNDKLNELNKEKNEIISYYDDLSKKSQKDEETSFDDGKIAPTEEIVTEEVTPTEVKVTEEVKPTVDVKQRKAELQNELDSYDLKPLQLDMSDAEYKNLLDKTENRISEINKELKSLEQVKPTEVKDKVKPTTQEIKQINEVHKNLFNQYSKKQAELIKEGLRGSDLENNPELVGIKNQMNKIEDYFKDTQVPQPAKKIEPTKVKEEVKIEEPVSTQKVKIPGTKQSKPIPLSDFTLGKEGERSFTKRVKKDEGGVSGVEPLNQFKLNQGMDSYGNPYPRVHVILDNADAEKYQAYFSAGGKKVAKNPEFRDEINKIAKANRSKTDEVVLDFRNSEIDALTKKAAVKPTEVKVKEEVKPVNIEKTKKIIEEVAQKNPEKVANATSKIFEDAGYHRGVLPEKSDYISEGYKGELPYTGYYFVSNPKDVVQGGSRFKDSKAFRVVDFSKYNLFKPEDANAYFGTNKGLKKLANDLENGIDSKEAVNNLLKNNNVSNRLKNKIKEFNDRESLEINKKINKLEELSETVKTNREFNQINNELDLLYKQLNSLKKESFSDNLNNILDEYKNERKTKDFSERLETKILKSLGYEGVDVRGIKAEGGLKSPDDFSNGSVIFDLKPSTVSTTYEAYYDALNIPEGKRTEKQKDLIKLVDDILNKEEVKPTEAKTEPKEKKKIIKTKSDIVADDLLSYLGIVPSEVKFSKTTGKPEIIKSPETIQGEVIDQMNKMNLFNQGVDLDLSSTTKEKVDIDELNSRLDYPLKKVDFKDFEGYPFIFTISDQLRTGDVVNPNTGQTVTDLKGGIGFNGTKGHENMAWANTTKEEAEKLYNNAEDVYNSNKALFEKAWANGDLPSGQIPMAVVKMAESSILSNEAVFRTGIQNVETLPKKNRKQAVSNIAESLKYKVKTESDALKRGTDANGKRYAPLTMAAKEKVVSQSKNILKIIQEKKYTDIVDLLKDIKIFSLPERAIIVNQFFYGSPTAAGAKEIDINRSKPKTKVSVDLIGNADPSLIHIGKITDLLTEPSTKNVPSTHITSIVGVKVANKVGKTWAKAGGPVETTHPNYPYGVEGGSIGVLEQPVHMKDAFGEAYGSVLSIITKNEAKKASISEGASFSQGLPVQAGLSNKVFSPAIAKGRLDAVDKLSGFLRQAFPTTTFFTTQEAWQSALEQPNVKKHLKDGDVIYAFTTDGNVYINPDLKTTKAALHETGHIWAGFVKENNAPLYNKGLSLVEGTNELKKAIEQYGDTPLAREEALMELMSSKGDTIVNASQKAKFKEWLLSLYKYISENFKSLMKLSPKEVENITLDKFLEGMLADILSGKELTTNKIKGETKFSKESQENSIRKFIEIQRGKGLTDNEIRAGILKVADQIGLDKSKINDLFKKETKTEIVNYKDLNRIEKRQIINSKFDELIKELKIEKICPT